MESSKQIPFKQLEQEQNINKVYYGKLKPILFFHGRPLILIGPDWQFFTGMISFLLIVGVLSTINCYKNNPRMYFIGSLFVTFLELFLYSYTALKDPGICIIQQSDIEDQTIQNNQKVCKICNVEKIKNRHHCDKCNICIEEYDHHCPWTSKCIGKGNITPFYLFLLSTILFMVYHFLVSLNTITIQTK